MLHQDVVPGGMVGHDIDDYFQVALVSLSDESLEISLGAAIRVNGLVIPNCVRASDCSFAHLFSNRMDRHQPENIDAEILQRVEPGGDPIEVTFCGKVAWKNLINHSIPEPFRAWPGLLPRKILGRKQRDREQQTKAEKL